jgi:hypothetical protein
MDKAFVMPTIAFSGWFGVDKQCFWHKLEIFIKDNLLIY